MADVTLKKVLESARALSADDQRRLIEILASTQSISPQKSLQELAAEQGKKPVNFDELLKLGEFFPQDESVDEFLAFVRESREDYGNRSI